MLTRETFLFFLQNNQGQSYYRKSDGTIDYTNTPTWLPEAPQGWFDQELSFGRNNRYWGLNRSYTQSFTFYNDGADILRYLFYAKKGIEEPVFLVVHKLDDTTDIYQPYFKGMIDMYHIEDSTTNTVKVNVIEGGLQKLIKAYENTMFEIPCDGSIAENAEILINGIMYEAIFNYTILPFTVRDQAFYIPLIFGSKEGNDVGIVKNDQKYVPYDANHLFDATYAQSVYQSTNYFFSSVRGVTGMNIIGSVIPSTSVTGGHLFFATSLGRTIDLIPTANLTANTTYNFNVTFDLAPGENMFGCFQLTGGTPSFSGTQIAFTFSSQFDDTTTWGIRPYDLLNLLMKKICNVASQPPHYIQYDVKSDLLSQYQNLVVTCGMALRQEPKAVIKTSLSQFFEAFDAILSVAMGVEAVNTGFGERLFFESLNYVLDSTNTTMDLGEVAEFKVLPATDMFFDVAKFGYPEQKYDEKQGNQEYNTTSQYRSSVKGIQREFKKISPYRGDSNGIEYTRFLIGDTNSSNNRSDNDVFIINTDFTKTTNSSVQIATSGTLDLKGDGTRIGTIQYGSKTGSGFAGNFAFGTNYAANDLIQYVGATTTAVGLAANISGVYNGKNPHFVHGFFGFVTASYRYPVVDCYFQFIVNNSVRYQEKQTLYDGKPFSFHFELQSFNLAFGDSFYINIVPVDTTQPWILNLFEVYVNQAKWSIAEIAGPSVYGLKRTAYDSSSGVDNIAYAYNIEDMTPARIRAKHEAYIKSVMFSLSGDTLTFQTNDKNKDLSTTLNGITITENDDLPISSIVENYLFYPFYFVFKTQVPVNFSDLLSGAANGHISFTFLGNTFYGFPMQVKQKPALNEAQEWKLLCSPLSNIKALINLEYTGINNINL